MQCHAVIFPSCCYVLSYQIRYSKNVGLGFKTPNEAKDGDYVDKKCPFTGCVQIRGRWVTEFDDIS